MGEIHLNCIVRCRCSTDLKQPFVGKVIKMDDDEAVGTILEYDPCERYVAYEINYTTRVKPCDLRPVSIKVHRSKSN